MPFAIFFVQIVQGRVLGRTLGQCSPMVMRFHRKRPDFFYDCTYEVDISIEKILLNFFLFVDMSRVL